MDTSRRATSIGSTHSSDSEYDRESIADSLEELQDHKMVQNHKKDPSTRTRDFPSGDLRSLQLSSPVPAAANEHEVTRKSMHRHKASVDVNDLKLLSNSERKNDEKEEEKKEIYTVPPLEISLAQMKENYRRNSITRKRRWSLSSQSIDDFDDDIESYKKVVHKKPERAIERIKESVQGCFLFSNLDENIEKEVIDAMFQKHVETGEIIFRAGQKSKLFYVVESGVYECRKPKSAEEPRLYNNNGVFGEYSLMYNTPREITVKCLKAGCLWCLEKDIFQRRLFLGQRHRRQHYSRFIKKLKWLDLDDDTKQRIGDCLQTQIFAKDKYVVRQGDKNPEGFYIIEKGTAVVTQFVGSIERQCQKLGPFDFFGELALLEDQGRRTASIKALEKLRVVKMDNRSFWRLLANNLADLFRKKQKEEYSDANEDSPVAPGKKSNALLFDLDP